MSEKKFMKGCEAVAEAAIRAGCRFFAGYPITPQNEVPEYLSRKMPQVSGVFMQGSSEVESSAMVFGGAASGTRSMISSASCGISLMSETISWMALCHLPVVICNFQRGGPGIGPIQPSQQDYFQATKASGNGGFQMLVLAPSGVQEAVDMTYRAFDLADKYLYPTVVLADGFIGTMMEPVEFPEPKSNEEIAALKAAKADWLPTGNKGKKHLVFFKEDIPVQNRHDAEMYERWKKDEVEVEEYLTTDAELILTAFGTSARICKSAVDLLRDEGYKVGLIRPIKVNPFPTESFEKLDYSKVRGILSVEMSVPALFAVDVANAVHGRTPIETCLTSGGIIIDRDDVLDAARKLYGNK